MPTGEGSLSGRLAIVIGGAGGIGGAVCQILAERGARVVVAGSTLASIEATAASLPGTGHIAMTVDVGDADSVECLFNAVKGLGPLSASIVVNCAGFVDFSTRTVIDYSEEMFDRTMLVNFKGTFLVCRAAARAMLEAGVTDGAIVNMASRVANDAAPSKPIYAASKAAVVSFPRSLAAELAPRGIRCNSVRPGLTDTPLLAAVPEKALSAACQKIPLVRPALPREVAEVIAFLCSPKSSYVTGSAMVTAGGRP